MPRAKPPSEDDEKGREALRRAEEEVGENIPAAMKGEDDADAARGAE